MEISLDKLKETRAKLAREIEEIDTALAVFNRYVSKETPVNALATEAKERVRPVGRGPTAGLRGAIASILISGPATTRQIRDQLISSGSHEAGTNLQAIVNNTIRRNPQQFTQNELGAWELVPEAAASLI